MRGPRMWPSAEVSPSYMTHAHCFTPLLLSLQLERDKVSQHLLPHERTRTVAILQCTSPARPHLQTQAGHPSRDPAAANTGALHSWQGVRPYTQPLGRDRLAHCGTLCQSLWLCKLEQNMLPHLTCNYLKPKMKGVHRLPFLGLVVALCPSRCDETGFLTQPYPRSQTKRQLAELRR